jgi:hypothetical protein
MPLSEKELATLLWEHPLDCQQRGLATHQPFFSAGRRYRNLPLGPYGTAQLVNVRFSVSTHCYYVQLFSFSTGPITAVAYQQTKRHLSALRQTLEQAIKVQDITAKVSIGSVLIGRQVQLTGNLVYLLNLDASCQAFTYRYDVDGVHFEPAGTRWQITGSEQAPALQALATDLLDERTRALATSVAASAEWLASATTEPSEYSETLVVTAGGVVENSGLSAAGEDEDE